MNSPPILLIILGCELFKKNVPKTRRLVQLVHQDPGNDHTNFNITLYFIIRKVRGPTLINGRAGMVPLLVNSTPRLLRQDWMTTPEPLIQLMMSITLTSGPGLAWLQVY